MKKSYVTKCLRTRFSIFRFFLLLTFALVFFLFPQNVYSLDTTLVWDPNSEENLAGYRIFYREDGQSYDYEEPAWEGSETTCTIYNLDDNTTYYFVARAFDTEGSESGDSNETCYQPSHDTPDYSLIPQSQLSIVSVDSEELEAIYRPAENVIDGVTSTFWHTEWYRSEPTCPHEIVINLGDIYLVGGFQYLPRQDGNINGTVADYSIYVSEDGITWGEAVATETFAGDITEKEVMFTGKSGRYVRFVAMSEVNGNPWTSAAEINVLGTVLRADSDGDGITDDDEMDIYGTDPDKADTDGDGISDGEEVALWGDDWDADYDSDGIINLLDPDADGDGVSDGEELELGTDPAYPDTPDYSLIPQSQLSIVSVDSEELEAIYRPAENVIDGVTSTFWHTEWYRSEPTCPHEIVIDLGDIYLVGGFQYLPRQDGNINGTVADYSIYVSEDGITWGEAVATETFAGDITEKEVMFTGKSGRYVRFVAMSEVNGNPWTSAAEINVLGTVLRADSDGDGITDDDEIDIYGTDPDNPDTDGDGINDGDEINIYGTDPDKADTDGDGISDGEEVALWGDDWDMDFDNDGIINILDPDSDNDGFSDGTEKDEGFDPGDPNSNPAFPLEIGEVSVNHDWKRVEFNSTFIDPVVTAKPLSHNGSDPAVLRIRNVDSRGFDIRVQEWDYLDGTHFTENASYIVMERGSHILEDGTKVEAGKFDTDATGSFGWVDFSQTFNQVPVVTSTVSSFNEEDAVCSRLKNIETTGFDFCMQEQEGNSQIHTIETISYIAWEPSSGTVGNLTFEVDKTDDVITHNLQTIVYNETFIATPVFLADMQTTDGNDTANLRWQNKDFYGIDIKITEEQSHDSEINHTTEVVGYMVFAFIE